jgi:NADPH:quinone reductase-like Zn-dependent oxidoreductase
MKAIVRDTYGSPDVVELREIDRPPVSDDGVLVRVHAASVNPVDWHMLTGTPYLVRMESGLRRPKNDVLGTDFAGTVEAVGKDVKRFQPGDEVFGAKRGALAEYVCVPEDRAMARKPSNVTFQEAAAVPVAAITALQALRDKGRIQPGQKVLVNGASGGVGTFAVQIAKSFGAEVTGVCSTRNVDAARSLGAERVIDYTREDFTRSGERYDRMVDIAGTRSWSECKRVLADSAICVAVGDSEETRWLLSLASGVVRYLATLRAGRRFVLFLAKLEREDLETLSKLLASGEVRSVIDRQYELGEAAEALRYLGEGHARGKVVLSV